MNVSLKAQLHEGKILPGVFLNLAAPLAAEVCALAGMEWVLVDLEHGAGSEADLLTYLQTAKAAGIPALVRLESHERARFARALDLGANGVMVPRVDSLADAQVALSHLRYPPLGDRGVAVYNRACGFGTQSHLITRQGHDPVCVIQIETLGGLDAVHDIAALDGTDALFIGPGDLSHAMGVYGRVQEPRFQAALATVVEAARGAGIAAGIMLSRSEEVEDALALGFSMLAVGSDSGLLLNGARCAVEAVRSAADRTAGVEPVRGNPRQ
jgi:4-hydroxy-2-oxoheptanedioate aldolase